MEEHLLKFRLANGQIGPKLVEKDPVAAYKEMRQQIESADQTAAPPWAGRPRGRAW